MLLVSVNNTWGVWSPYTELIACSVTCGSGGVKTMQRSRTCNNDNQARNGCGAQSPQLEKRTETCSGPACPSWGAWTSYRFDQCSKTCGTGATRTGIRNRICLNDIASGFGCGSRSPQEETKTEACVLKSCAIWGMWSGYVDKTSCSVTCGTNGVKTIERRRTCINDNQAGNGCGAQSPQLESKTAACSGPTCPAWGIWSSYTYNQCSATCGSGVTQTGTRRRTCLNDIASGFGCGSRSPQEEKQTRACTVNPCPAWGMWSGYTYGQCSATCGSGVTQTGTRQRTCLNDIASGFGCGTKSPQVETQSRACTVNPCPKWGPWTGYTDITACSVTCGPNGVKRVQRTRVCTNDIPAKNGCGAQSPQAETRSEQCFGGPCPVWGFWSRYTYTGCTKTCGSGATQVGTRTRICLNDIASRRGCGELSPQSDQQTRDCTLNPCPQWAPWSGYTAITACSVTCGPNGVWTTRRTRICNNDTPSGTGCGLKSPQQETRQEVCLSSTTCPFWGAWSGFTFSSCSKTCGSDSTRSGRRTRICLNNIQSGLGCGAPSPQADQQTQNCTVPLCPFWSTWTSYTLSTPCSVTCGPNGFQTLQRTRVCNNDLLSRRGCGKLSPDKDTITETCAGRDCPFWGSWTPYTYTACSATCGPSITRTGTRTRTCINDNASGRGCGALSPEEDKILEGCQFKPCPKWGSWTPYTPTEACSVTCGPGGRWRTQRSRQCVNDIPSGRGCGELSPQTESKTESCTSSNTCPFWGAWSGYTYGGCSATCGTGVTRMGTRSRICRNDNQQGNGCGATSPQQDAQPQPCQVPLCPSWGVWSPYSPSSACSVTCGSDGTRTVQSRRVCNNDIPQGTGCGSKSPEINSKTESCSVSRQCPQWSSWTAYTFGSCSATCGKGITRTGTRTRTCLNDIQSGLGCGSKSPEEQRGIQNCDDKPCPAWSVWSPYTPIGPCSLTCGSNGVWNTRSTRTCVDDVPAGDGCGAKSPQERNQIQTCPSVPVPCPKWSFWTAYSYTPCSATCGTGSRSGTRTRTCLNDDGTGRSCGGQSPQQQRQTEACVGPVCPIWSSWTEYRSVGPCSVTCGPGGVWTTQRSRVCQYDVANGNGCGASSPQSDSVTQTCVSSLTCPYWGSWSGYTYTGCSATCGTGVTRMGTKTRICQNDNLQRNGCGATSPQQDSQTQACQVPLCPNWGLWSPFSPSTPCSITCGAGGRWTVQRKRICVNDIPSGTGCGSKSPLIDSKTETCSTATPCPAWTAWTDYAYGPCSATCGRSIVRTGTRSRTCQNDISSGLGCGARSPDEETTIQNCQDKPCPSWSTWTPFTAVTQCSVTCGSGGVWTKQRSRQCNNDIPGGNGCGASSPQQDSKSESCSSPISCPFWASWSGFVYGTCSATCGAGVTRTGTRTRICINDDQTGRGCGDISPQTQQAPKTCRVPACPSWAAWSDPKIITPCSVTCGSGGSVSVQRRRVCNNDIPAGTGCGSQSPQDDITTARCSNPDPPPCPTWETWTGYTFTACSATCGKATRTGTRFRTCRNDLPSKLGCGAKSPEQDSTIEDCVLSACPSWSTWTPFTPTEACSVTCGPGGSWRVQRTRTCINDNQQRNGCGAQSPQPESKTESCSSPNTCPYWSSWSGFTYGGCSASCGTGITRSGIRSRICRNDIQSGGGCGAPSPQRDSQTQLCLVPLCPNWGDWSGYTPIEPCSVTCGTNGVWTTRRQRKCNNDISSRMGCGALSPQGETRAESCSTSVACPFWSDWSTFVPVTACSVTCGNNGGTQTMRRNRNCVNDIPGGGGCKNGLSQEIKTQGCFPNTQCPVDGQWGPWKKGAVGQCSVTCGKGNQKRTLFRACDSPAPQNNGRNCVVINGIGTTMEETESCTKDPCPRAPVGLCDSATRVRGVGYRLHPTDCDKFIQCYYRDTDGFSIGVVKTCPFNHYWDQKQFRCDLACNVDCPIEKCKNKAIETYNVEASCRAYWSCSKGKSEAMCCPAGFAYVHNRGCQVDFTCRDKCPTICATKDVCEKRPMWNNTNRFESSMGTLGWFPSSCLRNNLYFDVIGCECSTAATTTCAPNMVLDFSTQNMNAGTGITVSVSNIAIAGGIGSFSGRSLIRTDLALSEAAATKPIALVFQYKELAVVKSRQVLFVSPQCKMAGSSSMVIALEMDTFVIELKNWFGSRVRMTIATDGFPVDSWKQVQFVYDGKFMTLHIQAGNRKYAEKAYAPQIGLIQCGLDIGTDGTDMGYTGQMDTIGVYRCDPTIPRV
ncbi:SCO-spondin-like isoform X2 [Gigantopelta aegis]|uniref:SCO-spondin-like isoform X2 n=1 Tax=Gigantopelta aegis TaxID=1735272 RepID=UPI001B88CA7D|nr:SCO-spondin-like isoform X2 [Gigantopelta aegis]